MTEEPIAFPIRYSIYKILESLEFDIQVDPYEIGAMQCKINKKSISGKPITDALESCYDTKYIDYTTCKGKKKFVQVTDLGQKHIDLAKTSIKQMF